MNDMLGTLRQPICFCTCKQPHVYCPVHGPVECLNCGSRERERTMTDMRAKRPNPVAIPSEESVEVPSDAKALFHDKVQPYLNRFDPFEALDMIRKFTVASLEHDYTINIDDLHTIEGRVEALRAYITGMEK